MHRDPNSGAWHANIAVFGAWHAAIGYTLDWLVAAPPQFAPRRRMIVHGDQPHTDPIDGPWYSLVDLALPVAEHRDVPVALHVAAVTGTWGSEAIERHLFDCADLVIYFVELTADHLERTSFARPALDAWIAARGEHALVVVQLDRVNYARVLEWRDPPPQLDPDAVRAQLGLAAWPYHVTTAYNRDHAELGPLFRTAVASLLAARDRLSSRPSYLPD